MGDGEFDLGPSHDEVVDEEDDEDDVAEDPAGAEGRDLAGVATDGATDHSPPPTTSSGSASRSNDTDGGSRPPEPEGPELGDGQSDNRPSLERDAEESGTDPNGGRTRDRDQFPNYLPEDLIEEINKQFGDFNARRQLNDEPGVEKHKGFLEAVWRHFCEEVDDDELAEYIPAYGYKDE